MYVSAIGKRIARSLRVVALLTPIFAAVSVACAQGVSQPSPSGISVEASEQVFATLCALDAAGFEADTTALAQMPGRLALRDQLVKMQGPTAEALRAFYRDHALASSGETLSRYITLALVVGPPPQFRFQVDKELLPPDVLAVEGFQELLVSFYREANLGAEWRRIEPEYNRAIARDQATLRRVVTVTNAYLRELLKPSPRTFTVYVEPLVGNRINFRNTGDHYAIVIGTGPQIPVGDIQHAYLHFMLDRLPLQYRQEVERKKELLQAAARAPQLPVPYRDDFLGFADECLIKAVELRLRRLSSQQLDGALAADDAAGFILVRPLVAQLGKFEKAEPAMSYYFPDLIAGVDVEAEQERLKRVTFAALETPPAAEQTDAQPAAEPATELDRLLAIGDQQIAARDAAGAAATFQQILLQYPNEPRARYGLAVASVLGRNIDRATDLFESLVARPANSQDSPVDSTILAWSHVYLGRIHDLESDRDEAVAEYRAALAVEGAPEAARAAAQQGAETAYKPPSRDSGGAPQKP